MNRKPPAARPERKERDIGGRKLASRLFESRDADGSKSVLVGVWGVGGGESESNLFVPYDPYCVSHTVLTHAAPPLPIVSLCVPSSVSSSVSSFVGRLDSTPFVIFHSAVSSTLLHCGTHAVEKLSHAHDATQVNEPKQARWAMSSG